LIRCNARLNSVESRMNWEYESRIDQENPARQQRDRDRYGEKSSMSARQSGVVRALQMELFEIEVALSEFEAKRKEIKIRLVQLGAGTKTCTKCLIEMPVEQFYRDAQKIDKRSSWCIECKIVDVRNRSRRVA
jgi:hypothetical protein